MAKARPAGAEKSYHLPPGTLPRGLSRVEAASYVGVSPSLFDEMVRDHRMPRPKRVNTRTIWDRMSLDQAFQELADDEPRATPQKDVWSDLEV
jgi:predicted DNA-binding transcriptional regulator AlpA